MTYSGRLGDIIDNARVHFNESTSKNISDAQLMAFVLVGYREVGRWGYWRAEGTIDAVSAQYIYDLSTLFPRFNKLHECWWTDETVPMQEVPNKTQFERMKRGRESLEFEGSHVWTVHTNQLYIDPIPTENESAAMRVFYSYYPDDLGDSVVVDDITGSVTTYTKDATAKGHINVANSDVGAGSLFLFHDGTTSIVISKTSDGTGSQQITLAADHATDTISGIYEMNYATNVTPEWPEQYDDFLSEMATHYAFLRDGKSGNAEWWWKKSRITLADLFKQNRGTQASVRPT